MILDEKNTIFKIIYMKKWICKIFKKIRYKSQKLLFLKSTIVNLRPDLHRSQYWHLKNGVWSCLRNVGMSQKCLFFDYFSCFLPFLNIWLFYILVSDKNALLPWFMNFFNYFQVFLTNPSWCLHFSLQNAYLIYGI